VKSCKSAQKPNFFEKVSGCSCSRTLIRKGQRPILRNKVKRNREILLTESKKYVWWQNLKRMLHCYSSRTLSLRLEKVSVRFLWNSGFLVDHEVALFSPWPHRVLRSTGGSRPDDPDRYTGWCRRLWKLLSPFLGVRPHPVLRSRSNNQVTFPSFWPHHVWVLGLSSVERMF
jgi:hypothetical protein